MQAAAHRYSSGSTLLGDERRLPCCQQRGSRLITERRPADLSLENRDQLAVSCRIDLGDLLSTLRTPDSSQ
jgi:hypothetical protein